MKRVVVTPLYGIGDTLMLTPILRILKEQKPDIHLAVVTLNKPSTQLLEPLSFIDEIIFIPELLDGPIQGVIQILKRVTFRFDSSITFYPSNKASYNIFALITGALKRYGHRYVHTDLSQLNWFKNRTIREVETYHCVEENAKLLGKMGIDIDLSTIGPMDIALSDDEKKFGKAFVTAISSRKKTVGIHAGTSTIKGHINRRWPSDNFLELMNSLPDIHFYLFGAGDEVALNKELAKDVNSGNVTVVEGRSIRDSAAIIHNLSGFLSNDSGLMHLAAAVGTKVVAVMGPTNPAFIYPWGVDHKVVTQNFPCSPCFYYSPKPLSCHKNGQFNCLKGIETETVKAALGDIIGF